VPADQIHAGIAYGIQIQPEQLGGGPGNVFEAAANQVQTIDDVRDVLEQRFVVDVDCTPKVLATGCGCAASEGVAFGALLAGLLALRRRGQRSEGTPTDDAPVAGPPGAFS